MQMSSVTRVFVTSVYGRKPMSSRYWILASASFPSSARSAASVWKYWVISGDVMPVSAEPTPNMWAPAAR